MTSNKTQTGSAPARARTTQKAAAATQARPAAAKPAPAPDLPAKPAPQLMLNPDDPREREIMFAERKFAFMQRRAQALMTADIIPKAYKGSIGNCMIALDIAERLGVGEIEVMQNLDVIHGRPAWRAKWLIARINASRQLAGRLQFVWEDGEPMSVHYRIVSYDNGQQKINEGDQKIVNRKCYCIGQSIDGQGLIGPKISLELAVLEGWYNKPGSKWSTMPEKMFMYRAAAWWADIHMPEAGLGFMTTEEASEATFAGEREVGPKAFRSAQELLDAHRREKTQRDQSAGKEGAPSSSSDPASPDIDTAEEIVNAMTYEEVANELNNAKDEDALFLAADLIRSVMDEKERADLGSIYDQCMSRISAQ